MLTYLIAQETLFDENGEGPETISQAEEDGDDLGEEPRGKPSPSLL